MKDHAVKTPPKFRRTSKRTFREYDIDDHAHIMAGDHYGTGKKAPMGKLRSDTVGYVPVNKKGLKTPPKSTA